MGGMFTYVSLHDTKRTYLKIQKTPANAMKEMTYDRFVVKYIKTHDSESRGQATPTTE